MNYVESVAYIESLSPTTLDPSLARFAFFMEFHGSLQDTFPTIHVAGTNGKGTTVAIVESVLRRSGLKTGRFTGPHLLRWNERFHVKAVPISDEQFSDLCTSVREKSEAFGIANPQFGRLTWFEFLTAIAFFWFSQEKIDVGVIEVGLGGRWDATNVISKPLVTAITTIDYDHMHILGSTLPQIAAEKAGIIKDNVPLVTAAREESLFPIINRATECSANLYIVSSHDLTSLPRNFEFCARAIHDARSASSFAIQESLLNADGTSLKQVDFNLFFEATKDVYLRAPYQKQNALIAFIILAVAEQLMARRLIENFSSGVASTYWAGRFQYLPELSILMDGAHNEGGARALKEALDSTCSSSKRLFVLSFFENKNVQASLREMLRPGDRIVVAEAKSHRPVCKKNSILQFAKALGVKDAHQTDSIADALQWALEAKRPDELIIATGSFATVKECMLAMGWRSVEDGMARTQKFAFERALNEKF